MGRRNHRTAVGLYSCIVSAALALTGTAAAAELEIRNETTQAVIIQPALIAQNAVRRSRPTLLLPGRTYQQTVAAPGSLVISVYDANQPSRLLAQDTMPVLAKDVTIAVRPAVPLVVPGVQIVLPRVQLVAVKVAATPAPAAVVPVGPAVVPRRP